MVCFHFPQRLFQLLNEVQEGRRVGLQHLGCPIFVLIKMELYGHSGLDLLSQTSAGELHGAFRRDGSGEHTNKTVTDFHIHSSQQVSGACSEDCVKTPFIHSEHSLLFSFIIRQY